MRRGGWARGDYSSICMRVQYVQYTLQELLAETVRWWGALWAQLGGCHSVCGYVPAVSQLDLERPSAPGPNRTGTRACMT